MIRVARPAKVKRNVRWILSSTLGLGLAVAACGGSDDDPAGAPAAASHCERICTAQCPRNSTPAQCTSGCQTCEDQAKQMYPTCAEAIDALFACTASVRDSGSCADDSCPSEAAAFYQCSGATPSALPCS